MRQNEIRKRAEAFCKTNSITEYPVEIVRICNENGLQVFEEYLQEDVSGLIIVDEKKWEKYNSKQFIIVNLIESAARRRFTIAHELAHYILHKKDSKLYAHRDMAGKDNQRNPIEREANYFAANILMPEGLVKEKVNDIKNQIRGKVPGFILTKEIAENFAVSEAAADVRLRQLGII